MVMVVIKSPNVHNKALKKEILKHKAKLPLPVAIERN